MSIADVLDMTVREALGFFEAVPVIRDKLRTLDEVGLDYIRLGQSATTLSGGEAQRVKLATELSRRATGRTFYILDEPTDRASLRGYPEAARGPQPARRTGQHRADHRAQPGRHQDGGLGDRSRPRGGRRGRPGDGGGDARGHRGSGGDLVHRSVSARRGGAGQRHHWRALRVGAGPDERACAEHGPRSSAPSAPPARVSSSSIGWPRPGWMWPG